MRDELARRGVSIEPARIGALLGEGTVLSSLTLADGQDLPMEALYLAPRSRLNSDIAERLGCALGAGPFGPVIRTDATKLTTVVGV